MGVCLAFTVADGEGVFRFTPMGVLELFNFSKNGGMGAGAQKERGAGTGTLRFLPSLESDGCREGKARRAPAPHRDSLPGPSVRSGTYHPA